jgi:hypothetical protein
VVLSTDPLGPGPLPLAGMEGIDGIEGKPSAGTGLVSRRNQETQNSWFYQQKIEFNLVICCKSDL